MQTKSEMINRIAELAEEVEQWKHEYEVLDACLELAQGKIAELKAENDKLKEEIKQLEDFIKSDGEIDHINHEYTYKLKQTLQEIENVLSWVDSSNVWYNGQKAYTGDELIEFLKSRIINIINSTKAEEE